MEKIKYVHRQDSGFKLNAGNSGETSLNLSNDIFDLIAKGTLQLGEEKEVTFKIYKEDCIKAICFIILKLPLYQSSSNSSVKVTDSNATFRNLSDSINSFFGSHECTDYTVNLYYRNDSRIYLNHLRVNNFSIRDVLVENHSALLFKEEADGTIAIRIISNIQEGESTKKENTEEAFEHHAKSLQIIYYGAPGTGKSYCIKEQTKEADADKRVFRTTFHPDSDYSTFVGCYKPSMESKERLYDKNELISKLSVIKNTGVTYPCHKFAAKYWESLKQLSRDAKKDVLSACEFPESMVVEIDKGIVIGEELSHGVDQKQIVYRFVPQAFTNAYVKAYQTTEPVYLVIEEINRGNCAQIFGDLFQLLDRDDNGYSKYPIIADTDLGNHIRGRLQSVHIEGIDEAILEGQELVLPSNLYILASMNTSDQSLFPIDSAFKRRWDWKYIPIEDAGKGYTIKVNGHKYDWWMFLEAINKEVFELTNSEDKQMGYFFVKRPDGVIDAETLVNKVYFYLWNDVFKDYDLEGQKAFKKDDNKAISFKEFFAGSKINEALAEQVLLNLGLTYTDHPEL